MPHEELYKTIEQTDTCLMPLFQYNLDKLSLHQKGYTDLDLSEAIYDRVTVASAGPHASHLHLTPDR